MDSHTARLAYGEGDREGQPELAAHTMTTYLELLEDGPVGHRQTEGQTDRPEMSVLQTASAQPWWELLASSSTGQRHTRIRTG